jgi:hypothetical protein
MSICVLLDDAVPGEGRKKASQEEKREVGRRKRGVSLPRDVES